jgi:hypothetical protein
MPKPFGNLPKEFAKLQHAIPNVYPQTDVHSRTLTLSPPAGSRHNSVTKFFRDAPWRISKARQRDKNPAF